ncbi:MAG: hypothetical protein ACRELY_25365 [Polyangiaceae bacterium]
MNRTYSWTSLAARVPVLAVAGVAIFVLAQNGCSGSSSNGAGTGTDASTNGDCRPGETMTVVSGTDLCCTGTAPSLTCHSPGSRAGDPCAAGDTANSVTQDVTLDICINDACSGDRTPSTYAAKDLASAQPLACVNGTYQANGDPSSHEVDRVCNDVAPVLCASTTYGYYGYQTAYGYSYYGGQELMTRAVAVLSSTCALGGAAPTPCDVGSL